MTESPARSIELLAPAGSPACLKAACLAGADAVYLAGKRFGARAFAANFDEKSLRWARRVTQALGKKMYVTLNTIVFEHEWKLLDEALTFYESLQPDALIIQDIGVAVELKRRGSRIPLHLSTQGAWFGHGGAEELKDLGISRVILPREVSADELQKLLQTAPFELEIFVHGAMCYSISGRCFWSIALGTRSGNRGTCAQPCRREYSIDGSRGNGGSCLFSPRDLRLIDEVAWLKSSGVASLKIEGRMKSPEYVYQVVKAYREALDDGKNRGPAKLNEVFTRAASSGFFNGPVDPAAWQTGDNPGREGVVVGVTTGKTSDGLVELQVKEMPAPGDGIVWEKNGEQQGARITWVKTDRKHPKIVWVRGLPVTLGGGVELRRTSTSDEGSWESQWNRDWERRPVDLFWSGYEGTPLAVEAVINEHRLRLESEELLQLAMNKGLEEGPLQEKFAVLGDLFKSGRMITKLLGKGLHISGSALKKLKRSLVESLCRLEQLPPPKGEPSLAALILSSRQSRPDYSRHFAENVRPQVNLRVWNHSFPFLRDLPVDSWILPWHGDNTRAEMVLRSRVSWWLPPILTREQFERLAGELGTLESGSFVCLGWEGFALARMFPRLKFTFDWSFNICNLAALDYIRNCGLDAVFSREWREERIPADLAGFRSGYAWNPLVSFTRFRPDVKAGAVAQNSHNDRFFVLPVGNDVTAMFIEDKPTSIIRRNSASLQIDVAVSPEENPVQVAKDLNRMLESFRNA